MQSEEESQELGRETKITLQNDISTWSKIFHQCRSSGPTTSMSGIEFDSRSNSVKHGKGHKMEESLTFWNKTANNHEEHSAAAEKKRQPRNLCEINLGSME
jgi:hypothetical protein